MPCCLIHCVISVLISTILNNQTYVVLELFSILRGGKYLLSTLFLYTLIDMFMRIALSLCVLTNDLDKFNHLRTKLYRFYLKTQVVPRNKHLSPQLGKLIFDCCIGITSVFS
jgi:hypothetical protein